MNLKGAASKRRNLVAETLLQNVATLPNVSLYAHTQHLFPRNKKCSELQETSELFQKHFVSATFICCFSAQTGKHCYGNKKHCYGTDHTIIVSNVFEGLRRNVNETVAKFISDRSDS